MGMRVELGKCSAVLPVGLLPVLLLAFPATVVEHLRQLHGVRMEAGDGEQGDAEVHRVQDLLLLWQGVSGGALEEDPQAALQASISTQLVKP